MTIVTGTVLADRWELTSLLASGGMGDVYQARDRRGGEDVAIKVLRSGIVQGEQRFAGEVAMLRRLDHPHVVGVVDAGEHDRLPYLVMELLPGRSLSDLLRDGALDLERVRRIGAAIAAALAYAHGRGIINRDLKPSNILFDANGTAKLADFGIAKLMDVSGITVTGQALGTASYIAPEQLSAPDQVGPPTDVYSLGLVLLEAATGQRAFVGSGTEAAMARLARDPAVPAALPEAWQQLLRAMTARDPDRRPTALEVADLLDRELPEEAVQTMVVPLARGDDATMPMAMPAAERSPAPAPVRDETQVMGEQTHALAAGAAGARSGATASAASAAAPTRVSRPPRTAPPPRRRRGAAPWIAVVVLLIVIAGGVAFAVFGLGDDPEPELPAEIEEPPEQAPPPDEPEDTDPEEPAEEEEPPEQPAPEPEEPDEEPDEEPWPADDEPGGGPPDGVPGDPQGPPDSDGAGDNGWSDDALPLEPSDESSDPEVQL